MIFKDKTDFSFHLLEPTVLNASFISQNEVRISWFRVFRRTGGELFDQENVETEISDILQFIM